MSFIRCDRGAHPHRPPHAGDDARAGQPLRALRLPGRRPRRAGRRRGVPARAGLPAVVGHRPAHPGQPDLRLLARPRRVPGRALQRRRPVRLHPRAGLGADDRLRPGPVGAAGDQGLPRHQARPAGAARAARDRRRAARGQRVRPPPPARPAEGGHAHEHLRPAHRRRLVGAHPRRRRQDRTPRRATTGRTAGRPGGDHRRRGQQRHRAGRQPRPRLAGHRAVPGRRPDDELRLARQGRRHESRTPSR